MVRSSPAAIIFALFFAEMTAIFEGAMLYAALPTLMREFGNPIMAGWLITAHLLISAAAFPIAGRLGDIRGRKSVMLVLLAVAAVGSVISAVTTLFWVVLIGRALQGIASAVLPLSIGIIRESLSPQKVPMGIGLLSTAQGMGTALGLVLGGVIVDHINWHFLFVVSAVLLAVSFVIVAWLVPRDTGSPPRHPIDWIEGLLPAPAIAALLGGVSLSKQYGWLDWRILGLFALGIVLLAAWARRSGKSPEPFIDVKLFMQRNVAVANIIAILLAVGTMQIVFVWSTYMQAPIWTLAGLGLTATVAGLVKLPSNFLSFFAGPTSGWLSLRFGNRLPVVVGSVMATVGWLTGLILPQETLHIILILCVISFGTTILLTALPNIIVDASPPARTSEAIGTFSVVRGLFAGVGAQVIALLLATDTVSRAGVAGAYPTADAFRLTIIVVALLTLAGAALSVLLRPASQAPVE